MHNRKTHNFIYNTYNYGGLHERDDDDEALYVVCTRPYAGSNLKLDTLWLNQICKACSDRKVLIKIVRTFQTEYAPSKILNLLNKPCTAS